MQTPEQYVNQWFGRVRAHFPSRPRPPMEWAPAEIQLYVAQMRFHRETWERVTRAREEASRPSGRGAAATIDAMGNSWKGIMSAATGTYSTFGSGASGTGGFAGHRFDE